MPDYRLYQRNGLWCVEWYDDNGQRRRRSTGSRDKAQARQVARGVLNGNATIRVPERTERARGPTVWDALDHCSRTCWSPQHVRSHATTKSNIKFIGERLGDVPLKELTYERLLEFVQEMRAQKYAPGTIKRKLNSLSKALTEATKVTGADGKRWLQYKPPLPEIVVENNRDRVISLEEEAAIFAAIHSRAEKEPTRDWKRFAILYRFLLDTGCRLGEALALTPERLNVVDGVHYMTLPRYSTKNRKPRTLPLSAAIVDSIPFLKEAATSERLFPLKPQTVWYMWNNIRKDVIANGHDVSNVVLHTMRHTTLTRLARSGKVRIERLSDWAGHSNINVTLSKYVHLMPEDKLDTLAVIESIGR